MADSSLCPQLTGLRDIAERYQAIICDIWGVIHNGVAASEPAFNALIEFRKQGKPVVLLTNAPRTKPAIIEQLGGLGVPAEGVWDDIISSGGVTRQLVSELEGPVYHLGPEFNNSVFEGTNANLVDWRQAETVVCTGLVDDFKETPEDYRDHLQALNAAGLPMICANPDIVVEHGDVLRWCAGALGRDYQAMGADVKMVGKPHLPIYEFARHRLSEIYGSECKKSQILAIGDGMWTDIAGAKNFGVDSIFVTEGIHNDKYGVGKDFSAQKMHAFLNENDACPVAWTHGLNW